MKSDLVLRSLVNSQPHVKRVIDRVRYLFDTRSTVDLYELPEEPAEKRTAKFVANIPEKPPSTIESGRVEWTSEETESIREALTFWRKVPTKQEIQSMFQKSSVLRDIFRNNTFELIRNKVKNEFRKMSNEIVLEVFLGSEMSVLALFLLADLFVVSEAGAAGSASAGKVCVAVRGWSIVVVGEAGAAGSASAGKVRVAVGGRSIVVVAARSFSVYAYQASPVKVCLSIGRRISGN